MTSTLTFRANGINVLVEDGAVAMFENHRQNRFYHREAGGQLFGHVGPDYWKIIHATGPDRRDRRCRFGFRPDREREQKEIFYFHAAGFDYLGDWHTHPQDMPEPSSKDIASIEDIVQKSTHHLPGFLLCIVGRVAFPSGMWLSFHNRDGHRIQALPAQS